MCAGVTGVRECTEGGDRVCAGVTGVRECTEGGDRVCVGVTGVRECTVGGERVCVGVTVVRECTAGGDRVCAGVTAIQIQQLPYKLPLTTCTMTTTVRLTPIRHHSFTAENRTVNVVRNVEPVAWWRSVAVPEASAVTSSWWNGPSRPCNISEDTNITYLIRSRTAVGL